jgi:hypothetical protein
LSVTFAPPTDGDERALRVGDDPLERLDLALEQQAGGARQQPGDPVRRGVRAVRGAERVVDVGVGQVGVALRQLGVVLRLALLVADVLEHHDVAVRDAVERLGERHVDAEQLARALRHRLQAELGLAVLRPAEVRGEDEPGPALAQRLQRGKRGADAGVVGDRAVLERDVEVDPDEDPLAAEVPEVVQRPHEAVAACGTRTFCASSTTRFE